MEDRNHVNGSIHIYTEYLTDNFLNYKVQYNSTFSMVWIIFTFFPAPWRLVMNILITFRRVSRVRAGLENDSFLSSLMHWWHRDQQFPLTVLVYCRREHTLFVILLIIISPWWHDDMVMTTPRRWILTCFNPFKKKLLVM